MLALHEIGATWLLPDNRPLYDLSNEQLFKYPQAVPTEDAFWDFCKEATARVRTYAAQANKRAEIERREKQAAENLKKRGEIHQKRAELLTAEAQTMHQEVDGEPVLSHAQLQAFFMARHMREWKEMVALYEKNQFFIAQNYEFIDFLRAPRKEVREDANKFAEFQSIALLSGADNCDLFRDVRTFYHIRIMPTMQSRHEFLKDQAEGADVVVASLEPAKRREYWRWWRTYYTATVKRNWGPVGGMSSNAGFFSLDKPSAQEQANA